MNTRRNIELTVARRYQADPAREARALLILLAAPSAAVKRSPRTPNDHLEEQLGAVPGQEIDDVDRRQAAVP